MDVLRELYPALAILFLLWRTWYLTDQVEFHRKTLLLHHEQLIDMLKKQSS